MSGKLSQEVESFKQDLKSFEERVKYALYHGFHIAKAEEYAEKLVALGASLPKKIEGALAPSHLLEMIEQVVTGGAKEAKKEVQKVDPPKAAEPKAPEAAPPVKKEVVVSAKKEEAPPVAAKKEEAPPAAKKEEAPVSAPSVKKEESAPEGKKEE